MDGHHEVKAFTWPADGSTLILPNNWKPFTAVYVDEPMYDDRPHGYFRIVCRKWVRDTPKRERLGGPGNDG